MCSEGLLNSVVYVFILHSVCDHRLTATHVSLGWSGDLRNMQHSLHRRQAPSVHCSSHRIHKHTLVQPRRSLANVQHNPSSQQQQLPRAVAAAAQPNRWEHTSDQHIASGHEVLQAYAELEQQAGQQDDSSLPQQLVVQASGKLPNQADQLWGDPSDRESREVALVEPATRSYADLDYLSVGGSCRVTLPECTSC